MKSEVFCFVLGMNLVFWAFKTNLQTCTDVHNGWAVTDNNPSSLFNIKMSFG